MNIHTTRIRRSGPRRSAHRLGRDLSAAATAALNSFEPYAPRIIEMHALVIEAQSQTAESALEVDRLTAKIEIAFASARTSSDAARIGRLQDKRDAAAATWRKAMAREVEARRLAADIAAASRDAARAAARHVLRAPRHLPCRRAPIRRMPGVRTRRSHRVAMPARTSSTADPDPEPEPRRRPRGSAVEVAS